MATGDISQKWAADTQLTITLASLASDTNLLAGRESAAYQIDGLSFVEDVLLSGKITTGTSPTDARKIEVWVAAPINDTPTWPDVLDGTDSDETITSEQIKFGALRLAAVLPTNNASDTTYPFAPVSVASLFGGVLPTDIVVFVVHNTGVNLNSTGGNHEISVQPIYRNAVLA
jgi:hypothetical protein